MKDSAESRLTSEDAAGVEYVPEDDKIIGVVFRRSLVVIVAVGALVAIALFAFQRPTAPGAEQGLAMQAPQAVAAQGGSVPVVPFADVGADAGITFVHSNGAYGEKLLPETMGGGVALFDADDDGDADLLFVDSGHWPHQPLEPAAGPSLVLYRNDGTNGRIAFTDVTAAAGLADLRVYGMGAAIGDVDGDGDRDLFVTAVGENLLLRNDSDSDGIRFTDITAASGVGGTPDGWSTSAGFFDADRDGDLDLFVCNYVRWSKEIDFELDFRLTGVGRAFGPPQSYEGSDPFLYRNDGPDRSGTARFTDVSEAAGVQVRNPATDRSMAKSLALLPVDVDGDGWLDVMVANDTVQNFLFRNLGEGLSFSEEGELFGIAYDRNGNATGAMGVDAAFHRNDQNLAFLIGNFANEMSSAYVAQDDPEFFVDESITEGIGAPSRLALTFGLALLDVDLDGRLDLVQANGHIEDQIGKVDPSQHYRQPAQLFWNGGDEGFTELETATTGDLAHEIVGRGLAFADLDADGDLDLVLTQIAGAPLVLRNDQQTGHHWLRVRLDGNAGNRDGIGAWVELEAGGVVQRRQVMPTRSYLSQVEPTITFGLAEATAVDRLTVFWPGGEAQQVEVDAVDRLIVVAGDV